MRYSTDGSVNHGQCPPNVNIPVVVTIPTALKKMHDSLARIAFDSKSCIETNGWRKKRSDRPIFSAISRNRWLEITTDLSQLKQAFSDSQLFEQMMAVLSDRYFDIDVDQMLAKISDLFEFLAEAQNSLLDIDPIKISNLDPQDPEYIQVADRISMFSKDYIDQYNDLARFFHSENPNVFPWLNPIRPMIEIDSPYL